MSRRSVWPACTLVVAITVLGACAVPTNDSPQAIDADAVPFGLLETTTTTTSTTVPEPVQVFRSVYLLETVDGVTRLVEVEREFTAGASDVREVLLNLLTTTPTEAELELGYSSAIPEGVTLLGADLDDETGLLTVQVDGLFVQVATGLQRSLAQIVYTATGPGFDGVRSLQFENADGEAVEALIDNSETKPVVNRSDYRNLAPET